MSDETHFPNASPIWGIGAYFNVADLGRSYQSALPITPMFPIVPSDTELLPYTIDQIFIGGPGMIKLHTLGDMTLTLEGFTAGTMFTLPTRVDKIFATGTTATKMVGVS